MNANRFIIRVLSISYKIAFIIRWNDNRQQFSDTGFQFHVKRGHVCAVCVRTGVAHWILAVHFAIYVTVEILDGHIYARMCRVASPLCVNVIGLNSDFRQLKCCMLLTMNIKFKFSFSMFINSNSMGNKLNANIVNFKVYTTYYNICTYIVILICAY